jgi:hypothetical protein
MRHPRAHLHYLASAAVLNHLQVSELSVDPVAKLREASSVSLARRAVGLAEDGGEQGLLASCSVAHQHQVCGVLEPRSLVLSISSVMSLSSLLPPTKPIKRRLSGSTAVASQKGSPLLLTYP